MKFGQLSLIEGPRKDFVLGLEVFSGKGINNMPDVECLVVWLGREVPS